MVWVLIYAGGIRKFYSFSEMSDFMGITEEELSPYRNKDSFRINGYNIKKEKSKSLLGRLAGLRLELMDAV